MKERERKIKKRSSRKYNIKPTLTAVPFFHKWVCEKARGCKLHQRVLSWLPSCCVVCCGVLGLSYLRRGRRGGRLTQGKAIKHPTCVLWGTTSNRSPASHSLLTVSFFSFKSKSTSFPLSFPRSFLFSVGRIKVMVPATTVPFTCTCL